MRAYKTFLSGLLDITDNLDAKGKVVRPADVIAHDGDDPYLVVAADKGTATFSDIANGVAEDYGFWLGDAFASGGSAGYDHKAMGITARGAWEAVKRHFREMGKDIQTEPFTVVGVGDMSGDVFGNGMLLSKADPAGRRLRPPRHLPRSRSRSGQVAGPSASGCSTCRARPGQDYDKTMISKGGGVFPRAAKSIPLSARGPGPARTSTADALAPADLIKAILKAPAELLYLGGIGTYVKAPDRDRRRGRRQGQRRRSASTRADLRVQGGRRGRQPRPDPGRAHRLRARRRADRTPTPSTTPPASTPPTTRSTSRS